VLCVYTGLKERNVICKKISVHYLGKDSLI